MFLYLDIFRNFVPGYNVGVPNYIFDKFIIEEKQCIDYWATCWGWAHF